MSDLIPTRIIKTCGKCKVKHYGNTATCDSCIIKKRAKRQMIRNTNGCCHWFVIDSESNKIPCKKALTDDLKFCRNHTKFKSYTQAQIDRSKFCDTCKEYKDCGFDKDGNNNKICDPCSNSVQPIKKIVVKKNANINTNVIDKNVLDNNNNNDNKQIADNIIMKKSITPHVVKKVVTDVDNTKLNISNYVIKDDVKQNITINNPNKIVNNTNIINFDNDVNNVALPVSNVTNTKNANLQICRGNMHNNKSCKYKALQGKKYCNKHVKYGEYYQHALDNNVKLCSSIMNNKICEKYIPIDFKYKNCNTCRNKENNDHNNRMLKAKK